MSLPPLANLFALREPDPEKLAAVARKLEQSGEFDEIWRPGNGWITAVSRLPDTDPDPRAARDHGLVFAEGRDLLCPNSSANPPAHMADLAARIRNAPETLDTLPGDFALLAFTPEGELTIVRACGGRVPFYLWQRHGVTAVATRLGDLLRYAGAEPTLDPLTCAVWASSFPMFPDNRSPLAQVKVLARGSATRIALHGEPHTVEYWQPRPARLPAPTRAQRQAHTEQLRELLLQYLQRELHPNGGNLLTFSGGVDSSSLAALAAGTLQQQIMTWSLLPPPGADLERERRYIDPLLDKLGVTHRWETQLDRRTRIELLQHAPDTAVFPVMHPALCELPHIQSATPVRVLFGGEHADEVCGSSFTLPDWATHTPLWRLLAMPWRLPYGPRDLRRWARLRLNEARGKAPLPFPRSLPPFTPVAVAAEYREWRDRRARAAAADRAPLRYYSLRAELDGFLAMNWEACSALGVRRAFPFFNRGVLELGFQCHPGELIGPGNKRLLRGALAADVPALNLNRADKGRWQLDYEQLKQCWPRELPEALHNVIDPAWLHTHRTELGEIDELGLELLWLLQQRVRQVN